MSRSTQQSWDATPNADSDMSTFPRPTLAAEVLALAPGTEFAVSVQPLPGGPMAGTLAMCKLLYTVPAGPGNTLWHVYRR